MPKRLPRVLPVVGEIWKSRSRKGYTVEVLGVRWVEVKYGKNYQQVTYRTHTTPAKRPNLTPCSVDIESFLRGFRKNYDELEEL